VKPVGKYANAVVIDLAQRIAERKHLLQQLKDSHAVLYGKETAEEMAAREHRKLQRLTLMDELRAVMSKMLDVLGESDGKLAIDLALDDVRKHKKFQGLAELKE